MFRAVCDLPNCVQAGPEQAVLYANLYAHVYALLYAGVVAAGTCTAPAAGRYAALPGTNRERNRTDANGKGRSRVVQCPHPRPWRGAELCEPVHL